MTNEVRLGHCKPRHSRNRPPVVDARRAAGNDDNNIQAKIRPSAVYYYRKRSYYYYRIDRVVNIISLLSCTSNHSNLKVMVIIL